MDVVDESIGEENEEESDSALLTVELFSSQKHLPLPFIPFSIPEESDHDRLDSLVRSLLEKEGSIAIDQKFDFLLDGHLIRSTLKEIAADKEIAQEHVLKIEVIIREPPPELTLDIPHADWVAAVIADAKCIISATYDGVIHLWSRDKQSQVISKNDHSAAVKSLAFLPGKQQFVSASQDQSLMIWDYDVDLGKCECVEVMRGHERSVECCCVNDDATRICSAGFDTFLKIWSTEGEVKGEISEINNAANKKRRMDEKCHVKTPMVTLSGHKEAITGVQWGSSPEEVITVSWDHTIRTWDLTLAGQKDILTGPKALTCVSNQLENGLILTGSSDRHVRLWDPRSKEGSLVKTTYSSHTNWVTAVKWNQTNSNQFVTSSFDRLVKLWDTRSNKAPLYDLAAHNDKALSCTYSTDHSIIVSGGADNAVKVYQLNR